MGSYVAELAPRGTIGLHDGDNAAIIDSANLVDEAASEAGAESIDRLGVEEGVVALDAYGRAPWLLPSCNATCYGRAEAGDQSACFTGTLC